MSLQMLTQTPKSLVAVVVYVFAAIAVWGQSTATQQVSSSDHQVVVLLDVNPHQRKVLPVELALAEGIINQLGQPENTFSFSVITFGSKSPILLKAVTSADEAISAIRDLTVEPAREKYFSVHVYDGLNLAMSQFTDRSSPKSLLVISEGNDYFPKGAFKETVAKAQQLGIACDVVMVADHTLYGGKGIQHYGTDLRRLAGKTHGQYMEVGGKQKKVPRTVERLSEGILIQKPKTNPDPHHESPSGHGFIDSMKDCQCLNRRLSSTVI
jgi:hypothetical protein